MRKRHVLGIRALLIALAWVLTACPTPEDPSTGNTQTRQGALTISGLPSGGNRAVYVFSAGTDISTYTAISSAYMNGNYQAVGASLSGENTFTLYAWNGSSQAGVFTASGSFPVLLLNSTGSIADTEDPMYAQASVAFSGGVGTAAFSAFTAVVSGNGSGTPGGDGKEPPGGTSTPITALDLTNFVTAPVRGATPNTATISETQYTGSVAWKTSGGAAHSGVFAPSMVYRAVITLTAKSGYTFTGVTANSFTYTGATVTNAANSGTVTITFPETAGPNANIPIGNPSVKLYLNNASTPLPHNGTTPIEAGTGNFTVSIDSGSDTSVIWYLNGTRQDTQNRLIVLSKQRTAGNYLVTVEVTPSGGAKQSGAHTFVIQ
jgi:hypothetical protein